MLYCWRLREHPVERRDGVADRAAAVGVEDLQRDQRRIGRHAGMTAERIMAVARDDAGHVRPVALVVVGSRAAVDEVDEGGNPLIAVGIHDRRAAREIVVPGGDARIDDGHADAGAGEAQTLLHGTRAGRDGGTEVVGDRRAVVVHAENLGPRLELPQDMVRQVEHLAVDDAEAFGDAREPLQLRRQRRARYERDDDAGDFRTGALTAPCELSVELRVTAGRNGKRREYEADGEGRDERDETPARIPDCFGAN